jgi:hypothetical protein
MLHIIKSLLQNDYDDECKIKISNLTGKLVVFLEDHGLVENHSDELIKFYSVSKVGLIKGIGLL